MAQKYLWLLTSYVALAGGADRGSILTNTFGFVVYGHVMILLSWSFPVIHLFIRALQAFASWRGLDTLRRKAARNSA